MRYVEFLDIDVPNAGALGTIEFDPFLAAVASLKTLDGQPMVSHWIDPSPAMSITENGEFKLRDAAHEGVMSPASDVAALQKTNAINGQPTFTATEASTLRQGTSPGVNAEEWTMLAVHDLNNIPGRQDVFGIGGGGIGGGQLYPGLEITVNSSGYNQLVVREGGASERRIVGNIDNLVGVPVISCATFSTELGFSVFKNNMEGFFRDDTDKRPLTDTTFSYLGNRSGAQSALGDFGMAFILRADISRPEYAWARNVLIGGLMSKYGIS